MHLNKIYSFVGIKEDSDIAESRSSSDSRGQDKENVTSSRKNIFV